ncbi:MAG: hypothetical protein IKN48_09005 [Bacteroidaceae bacterium]|nr:hypothetical protein [Bacteroidaceae bacterium]
MATINDIIKAYYLHRSQGMMNELNNLHKKHFGKNKITQLMAKDIFEGTHQERLKYEPKINYAKTFITTCQRLMTSSLLANNYANFEDLYNDVENMLFNGNNKIKGIGKLTVYDIALRIGYVRNNQILPKKKIYLYAGAFQGANNLFQCNPSLFNVTSIKPGCYDMTIFNAPLNQMPSMFLEDMFCVYHSLLKSYHSAGYNIFQNVKMSYKPCK